MSGNAVDRSVFSIGIVVPQDFSSCRCVGAEVAVERTREHDAGNGGHRGRLRRTTRPAVAATRWRSLPDTLAIVGAQREHASTLLGIQFILPIVRSWFQSDIESDIGYSDVEVASIRGAPHSMPPTVPPLPTRACHSISPLRSGSIA